VLSLIVKADVQGSLETLLSSLQQILSDRVGLKVVRAEVGPVNEGDVKFAEATESRIFRFHTPVVKEAAEYARQKGIEIRAFEVIYEFLEAVREELSKLLEPEVEKKELGKVAVLAVFRTEPSRMIVGGKVSSGKISRGDEVEVMRGGAVIGTGKIVQLQKGEEKQEEVGVGRETGILFEGKVRIEEGDTLSAFSEEKVYPTL
jgi:translation initiation factor IF-2